MPSAATKSKPPSSSDSIIRWYIQELGLSLNPFIMDDNNTFYHVQGLRKKTYAVKANPDILKYNVTKREKGKSASELLQLSLQKVCRRKC